MRKVMKRIKNNLYRRYYKPEAEDFVYVILLSMAVGYILLQVIRWLA